MAVPCATSLSVKGMSIFDFGLSAVLTELLAHHWVDLLVDPESEFFDFSQSRSVSHAWPLSVVRVEGCTKRGMLTSHGGWLSLVLCRARRATHPPAGCVV